MLLIFRILPAFAILALGFVLAFIAFAFEMRTVRNIKGSKSEGETEARIGARVGKVGGQGNDGGREREKDGGKDVSSVKLGWVQE